jgi:2'-5' RNA ligase
MLNKPLQEINHDYAVLLCFDDKTEAFFGDIIKDIAESGAGRHMFDSGCLPHITIADFYTDNVDKIVVEIDNNISKFQSGKVTWASLGSFVPSVLFAAPVMNEYLLTACISINRLIKPFAPHCGAGFYLPYQWVPHTTLASRLYADGLRKAFDIAAEKFTFTKGKCVKLMLVRCEPYKMIKVWDLV